MKNLFYLAVLSTLVLGSCTKQEVLSEVDENLMDVAVYSSRNITKAANTSVPFKLYVTYNGSEYVPVTTMTYESSKWKWGTGSVKYYWPATVSGLKFYGVMDYAGGSTVTDRTINTSSPSSLSVSSVSGTEDLCVCYAAPTTKPSGGTQALTFNHAYTKFSFKLKAASDAAAGLAYKITAMTVSAKQAGTLTIAATPDWASGDPTGDAKSYTITFPTSKQTLSATAAGDAFGYTMIIPQKDVVLSITYEVYAAGSSTVLSTATKTATIDMSANIGKSTSYILTFDGSSSSKAITFTSSEDENWPSTSPSSSNITLN